MAEQSPKRLYLVRGKMYELLTNCVPPELLLRTLAVALMRRLDDELRRSTAALAAFYEHRLQVRSRGRAQGGARRAGVRGGTRVPWVEACVEMRRGPLRGGACGRGASAGGLRPALPRVCRSLRATPLRPPPPPRSRSPPGRRAPRPSSTWRHLLPPSCVTTSRCAWGWGGGAAPHASPPPGHTAPGGACASTQDTSPPPCPLAHSSAVYHVHRPLIPAPARRGSDDRTRVRARWAGGSSACHHTSACNLAAPLRLAPDRSRGDNPTPRTAAAAAGAAARVACGRMQRGGRGPPRSRAPRDQPALLALKHLGPARGQGQPWWREKVSFRRGGATGVGAGPVARPTPPGRSQECRGGWVLAGGGGRG